MDRMIRIQTARRKLQHAEVQVATLRAQLKQASRQVSAARRAQDAAIDAQENDDLEEQLREDQIATRDRGGAK